MRRYASTRMAMSGFFSKPALASPRAPLPLHFHEQTLDTSQLVPGIDNVRHDVALSPKFSDCCRNLIYQIILHYSEVGIILPNAKPGAAAARKEFKQQLQALLLNGLEYANLVKNAQLELLLTAAVVKFLGAEMQSQFSVVVLQCREKLREFQNPRHPRPERGYQLQEKFSDFQKNKRIILRKVGDDLQEMIEEVRSGIVSRTRESYFGEIGRAHV